MDLFATKRCTDSIDGVDNRCHSLVSRSICSTWTTMVVVAVVLAGFCASRAEGQAVNPITGTASTKSIQAAAAKPAAQTAPVAAKTMLKVPVLPPSPALVVVPDFTAEREAAALKFVELNHAELLTLLERLKARRSPEYTKAICELFAESERLAGFQISKPRLYRIELGVWKARSRLNLLAAQAAATNMADNQLDAQLRMAITEYYAAVEQQRVFDHEALARAYRTSQYRLTRFRNNLNSSVERDHQAWMNQIHRMRGEAPTNGAPKNVPAVKTIPGTTNVTPPKTTTSNVAAVKLQAVKPIVSTVPAPASGTAAKQLAVKGVQDLQRPAGILSQRDLPQAQSTKTSLLKESTPSTAAQSAVKGGDLDSR